MYPVSIVFLISIGTSVWISGKNVRGWKRREPYTASSSASENVRLLTGTASATIRGSAVITPGTSVLITTFAARSEPASSVAV